MSRFYTAYAIGERTWLILECGYNAIYYLEGDERGLLIDTGVGAGDLKSFVDSIATKPYCVALTHGHLDHIGAIWQYNEIYVNQKDIPLINTCTDESRENFMLNMYDMSEGRTVNQHPSDLLRRGENPTFHHVDDDFVFHLGNRDVNVFTTPGHTKGSVCFFDQATGFLFVGDTLIYRLLLTNDDLSYEERVKEWRSGTRKIYDHRDRFTAFYMGHCGKVPEFTYTDLDTLTKQFLNDPSILDTSESAPKLGSGKTRIYLGLPFEIS